MDVTLGGSQPSRYWNPDQASRVTIELAAFDGEIGVGAVPFDDPTAADDHKGGRQIRVDELTTLLVDGFIGDQDRTRGPVPITDREVVYSVQDPNALLFAKRARRSRPAETDVARVLAFAALDLSGVDTTWVLVANTVNMPAKKYDGEGWSELISDTVDLTGKTIFIHDKAAGGRCLHYHRLVDGHTCGLSISDAVTTNGPTVWIPRNPQKKTSPADLGNDILFVDQVGRTATYTDATSITNHDADGLAHQKIVRVEATSQAHLDAIAAAQGAETKNERFTWVCTIGPLDAAALALIRVGDIITTTSQVMGLTNAEKRIAHLTLTLTRDDDGNPIPGLWDAILELGAPIRRAWPSKGKSLSKAQAQAVGALYPYCVFTFQRETFSRFEASDLGASEFDGSPVWTTTGAGTSLSVDGNAAVLVGDPSVDARAALSLGFSGVVEVSVEWEIDDTDTDNIAFGFFALGGASGFVASIDIQTVAGGTTVTFGLFLAGVLDASFSVVDTGISFGDKFWVRMLVDGSDIKGSVGTSPPPGSTWDGQDTAAGTPETPSFIDMAVLEGDTLTVHTILVHQGLPYACVYHGVSEDPLPGQPIENEDLGLGDGTTVSFTTEFPFAPGSLKVYVDGVDQTGAIIFDEGNEFHLSFAPLSSERIIVSYQRAA